MEIRGENDENREANMSYTPESVADIPVLLLGVAEGGVIHAQTSWSSAGGWHWGWLCSAGTKLLFSSPEPPPPCSPPSRLSHF